MQYYQYQHADGTDDYMPYHCFNNYNYVAIHNNEVNEYYIMKARIMASKRGATPNHIQEIVQAIGRDDIFPSENPCHGDSHAF